MKRLLPILALLLVPLLLAADATACARCGLFGRKCRFASHHVAVVDSFAGYGAVGNTTFNFVNAFPPNLPIAAQGQSVYAYSLAAQAYSVDPAAVLAQAARLTTNAQALSSDGLAGYSALAQAQLAGQVEVAKVLAQGQTATAALLAAKGADTPASPPATFSFRATVESGGKLKVEPLDGPSVSALSVPAEASFTGVLSTRCAACHTGATAKGGLDLSAPGSLDLATLENILDRIESPDPAKRMPKSAPPLTRKDKAPLYSRFERLKGPALSLEPSP